MNELNMKSSYTIYVHSVRVLKKGLFITVNKMYVILSIYCMSRKSISSVKRINVIIANIV